MNFDLYFIGLKRKNKTEKERKKKNGPDLYPPESTRGPVLSRRVEPGKGRIFENKPVLPKPSNPQTRTICARANPDSPGPARFQSTISQQIICVTWFIIY